jgi:tetratricopeptide (TPR) repeat protein
MSTYPGSLTAQDKGAELFAALLANLHPLMVEAFCVAALPHWFDLPLFSAIRYRDDGRDAGLVDRLRPYSFVDPLVDREPEAPAYAVRARERQALNRHWIEQDKDGSAYRTAHARALAYWIEHPDPNPFAQAQNQVYHGLFVEAQFNAAVSLLISQFRTYRNERQFTPIDRLLAVGREAQGYLVLLGSTDNASQLEDLLNYLEVRLSQLRKDWGGAEALLEKMQAKQPLDPRIGPYVLRARGMQLQGQQKYVEAIETFKDALKAFDQELTLVGKVTFFQSENDLRAERAYTLIDLGRAHVDLADSVRGERPWQVPQRGLRQWVRSISSLLTSLPLVLYLTRYLGHTVWDPSFWAALPGLDWILARLYGVGARYYLQADVDLESFGQPTEATVADKDLADLYLTLGQVHEAELLYRSLAKESALVGPYRRATAQVSLAKTWLRQGHPELAAAGLPAALSALEPYDDRDLEAQAGELLGEALVFTGQPAEGIKSLAVSFRHYQESKVWDRATGLVERLQGWMRSGRLADDVLATAQKMIESLPVRCYPGRYRHPLLVGFRQFVLLMLPVVLLLIPLLTIKLGTRVALMPEIHFRPAPILDPNLTVTLNLSQGVERVDIFQVVVSQALLWAAITVLLVYLLLSLLLGLAAIAFTPLNSVQRGGRGGTVCLEKEHITIGSESTERPEGQPSHNYSQQIPWTGVTHFVRADTCLWRAPLADASVSVVAAEDAPLAIPGSTAWYSSLRDTVRQLLPVSASTINVSYSILRSPLGVLYLLNLVFLGVLGLLAATQSKSLIFQRLPGNPYSMVDLYPYFYLFLVIAPLWWAVVQPMRRRLFLQPRSRLPLIVLAAGLALVLAEVLLRFRPLLTVLDIYIPLTTVILLVSAEVVLWRARESGRPVYSLLCRISTAVVAGAACLLMLTVLWRDVRAYHYLVQGNSLRDQAMKTREVESAEQAMPAYEMAVSTYGLAAEVGRRSVWGIATQDAARIHVGMPPAQSLTWLSALTNEAALETQLSRYLDASRLYSQTLDYTDQPDQIHAWLAIASLGQGTQSTTEEGLKIICNQYRDAIKELNQAINLNPHQAVYYLWRGLAYHAISQESQCTTSDRSGKQKLLDQADRDYRYALEMGEPSDVALTKQQRERAHTGLGWLKYLDGKYEKALDQFQQATLCQASITTADTPTREACSEAWLGLGYALYATDKFDQAQMAWETAYVLAPRDPRIVLALATCHWKLGGKSGKALGRDSCTEYQRSAAYFDQATRRSEFSPQSDKDVAFTYRSLAQVQYLIGGTCYQPGKVAMYQDAVNSYTQALDLDPGQAGYWQMRGRIEYAVSLLLYQGSQAGLEPGPEGGMAELGQAMTDLEEALRLDPVDNPNTGYQPNHWMDTITSAAVRRGDARFDAGDAHTALAYYMLVAGHQPLDPRAALKVGLASLALGKPADAVAWYRSGLDATQPPDGTLLAQEALLKLLLYSSMLHLDPQVIVDLFQERGITVQTTQPDTAQLSFDLALIDLDQGDLAGSADFYHRGLELASNAADNEVVRSAANSLRDYLLANPDVSPTDAYWPLRDDLPERLDAVSRLDHPDLYWRYRADFGFFLLSDRLLMRRTPSNPEPYEAIFQSLVSDIERAYALNPTEHKTRRDFFVDANIGWLYLRRGDDYVKEGKYDQALADYEQAARRIQPNSQDAALDLTEDLFKAGLTALRLGQPDRAVGWYSKGTTLVKSQGARFGLVEKVQPAIEDLNKLIEEQPSLATSAQPILDQLKSLTSAP